MGRRSTIKTKERNRRIVAISAAVTVVAVLLVLVLLVQASSKIPGDEYSASIGQPVSPAVMQQVTGVNDSTLSGIGVPTSVVRPTAITGASLSLNGKPEVLYIGGDFCPFCAAERWSLILALSQFGTFSGLEYMQSSRSDTNPNTPTFTFTNATYTSQYITFVSVEEFNRAEQVVTTLTPGKSSLYSQYGTCAATGECGGIPFIDIANAYTVNCGAQFSLPQIAGENWTQVSSQLNDPHTQVAQEIDGAANILIAAICKADDGQPSSVCGPTYATVPSGYNTGTSANPVPIFGQSLLLYGGKREGPMT